MLSPFNYQLKHQAEKMHRNADGLSWQTTCLDCKQCAAIEKQDRRPSRPEIKTKLQKVGEVQAKDSVVRDQKIGGHLVATVYGSLQAGESFSLEELHLSETEFQRLYAKRGAFRIWTVGVMEI